MNEPIDRRREYHRPPFTRRFDPQRANWLWQLICKACDVDQRRLLDALKTAGVPATEKHLRSWLVAGQDQGYFPMNLAEIERNLRVLIGVRHPVAAATADAPVPVAAAPHSSDNVPPAFDTPAPPEPDGDR